MQNLFFLINPENVNIRVNIHLNMNFIYIILLELINMKGKGNNCCGECWTYNVLKTAKRTDQEDFFNEEQFCFNPKYGICRKTDEWKKVQCCEKCEYFS